MANLFRCGSNQNSNLGNETVISFGSKYDGYYTPKALYFNDNYWMQVSVSGNYNGTLTLQAKKKVTLKKVILYANRVAPRIIVNGTTYSLVNDSTLDILIEVGDTVALVGNLSSSDDYAMVTIICE